MPRPPTGTIIERRNAAGETLHVLRFAVNGRKRAVSLGAVSRAQAERKLRLELDRVAEGTWQPPEPAPTSPAADVPTFHAFADEWWTLNEGQWGARTVTDYRWRLERYLIPALGQLPINAIRFDTVDRYTAELLSEGKRIRDAAANGKPIIERYTDKRGRTLRRRRRPLSPRSINMTVTLLGAILESALERRLVDYNAARGKRRRVRERRPPRSYLEAAWQIEALLDAAAQLDAEATRERRHVRRRAMVAVLIFAGLRINELCELRWADVDLASGWLAVGSKTLAGYRNVRIRGELRDELAAAKAGATSTKDHVFATRTGRRMSADNVRDRVFGGAVRRANANLEAQGHPPLPQGLTPHSMRRTFASMLYALGESPAAVMQELGHTDPGLALRVYAQAMRRSDDERARLAALVEGGGFRHLMDTQGHFGARKRPRARARGHKKTPR
jgi:integrase